MTIFVLSGKAKNVFRMLELLARFQGNKTLKEIKNG